MGTQLQTTELHRRFGRRIQDLRKERGMTQEDLAGEVGVDRSYMGFLERGEKNATLDKIGKIAKAFRIKLKDLFDF
ncbi:MAG: helix-turn-helix transcriptional regulator [Candidatus Pacebacteria bacterium]|nr:helix-turn-helix transcriptional regulator [Candidatus Paceibacterota bacterium]